ncbi:MAG: phosphopantothenoylcysteine decarboxylase [Planctomycetes bacterium]|nr:phosphopantothenoylcysteine decarboxylase [Planctomycetota bacterium]
MDMRIIVTAGPTREYIDTVRFISNASSGRMGLAVADAAARAGHDVTILAGPGVALSAGAEAAKRRTTAGFVNVADLKGLLETHFDACDALVMAAAVGDFRAAEVFATKLRRSEGPTTIKLTPTQDVLARVAARKRPDQTVVAFAVEGGDRSEMETAALAKLSAKNADYIVVNPPAAMGAAQSSACILAAEGVVLPWADRPKETLAREIVSILEAAHARPRV